jgi:hypothetical protein
MIPAEAHLGTFVTLKGACGKTTTTKSPHGIMGENLIQLRFFKLKN